MPRTGRIVAPGVPHHVVQRGHNRNAVYMEERDYQYYLETLREWKEEYEIKVYA